MKNQIFYMKKIVFFLLAGVPLSGCGSLGGNYPLTTFFVKNTSDKPISFTTSIIKRSQMAGPQIITKAFTVNPNDSILARELYYKKDTQSPQGWFSEFKIMPVDGIKMNDPLLASRWKKSTKEKNIYYTFTLNKDE